MPYRVRLTGLKQRAYAHQLIDAAEDYSTVTITGGDRTLDQNAKMWAMLTDISRAKPDGRTHSPDVWKALMMNACGHAVQFTTGIDGEPFPVGFRSSKLTKPQMSDLIEFMFEYGARHGVKWSEKERK